MLDDGVVLKLLPVIVTLVPIGPDTGEKLLMTGWPKTIIESNKKITEIKIDLINMFRLDRAKI